MLWVRTAEGGSQGERQEGQWSDWAPEAALMRRPCRERRESWDEAARNRSEHFACRCALQVGKSSDELCALHSALWRGHRVVAMAVSHGHSRGGPWMDGWMDCWDCRWVLLVGEG